MELSVVIPVFNEGRKIDTDLGMAIQFFEKHHIAGEIIISDDGSTDDTLMIPENISVPDRFPIRIIKNKVHNGKGYAVKEGILSARGEMVLFIDSGGCVPYDNILAGIELVRSGSCEIAHGSRFLPGSIIRRKKQWYRRFLSFLFRKFIHIWMNIPRDLTDTQCGLKIYKKDVAYEIFKPVITHGFMFDIEVILRAKEAGYRIREFPVTWTSDPDSRMRIANTFFSIFPELRRIRRMQLDL